MGSDRARAARRRRCTTAALLVAAVCAARGTAAAAPRVVATVKPLHSLVAGVMTGVGAPELIMRGAGSPHAYTLKPSEARLLAGAQVVFWVGESLETGMVKPLAALGAGARVVQATRVPGVAVLPGREGGAWGGHDGDHDDHGDGERGGHARGDGHLWLDPANARAIARHAALVLGELDPENRGRYAANAEALAARIDGLDAGLRAALEPVRGVPFVVFHDAYQYFEKSYGLAAVGSVAVSAERAPGARRVRQIRDAIRTQRVRCVFSEPQFSPALVATLVEGTGARTGTLDPLGAALPAGTDAYFTLMGALGSSLAECLQRR